jgi:predicted ATP-dependent endonuclease of OLD family
MKITALQISNVLCFKYYEKIEDAPVIAFKQGVNLLIGENGSGKSTVLEIINYIFKHVFFMRLVFHNNFYNSTDVNGKKSSLEINGGENARAYRLNPNYKTKDAKQQIRITIKFDAQDIENCKCIMDNKDGINAYIEKYSHVPLLMDSPVLEKNAEYTFDITLTKTNSGYDPNLSSIACDFVKYYLQYFEFLKKIIELYNRDNSNNRIDELSDTFSLIPCYRDYANFQPSVKCSKDNYNIEEANKLSVDHYSKSTNAHENTEPVIFSLVRTRMTRAFYNNIVKAISAEDCLAIANDIIKEINDYLEGIHIKVEMRLVDLQGGVFYFDIFNTKHCQIMEINQLSSGQKAIMHLVFEAFGRDKNSGGVIIIDEPEIHLHYNLQCLYLKIIEKLVPGNNNQYIIATHSEVFISAKTILGVIRFSLDNEGYAKAYAPEPGPYLRIPVQILDNTRAAKALFHKKVILVEGPTDGYFFNAVLAFKYPEYAQDIAVVILGGKDLYKHWQPFFASFGLDVSFIGDLDSIVGFDVLHESKEKIVKKYQKKKINSEEKVSDFKADYPEVDDKIREKYKDKVYILSNGDLELYIGINKGFKSFDKIIEFSNKEKNIIDFFADMGNEKAKEINKIMEIIIGIQSDQNRSDAQPNVSIEQTEIIM